MARVVVVSNRVMNMHQVTQAGGAAVAIADTLRNSNGLWFGWSGEIIAEGPRETVIENDSGISIATIPLTQEEHLGYYLGYANSVLWPVFHNRLDLARFEAGYYFSYIDVNRRFAKKLKQLLRPDDIIWVHDYHLIEMARSLRRLGVTNQIGFFLHIPFPPSQTFLAIPEHRDLADALSAYDLVGLQTSADASNLIDYLEHEANGRLLPNFHIRVGERELAVEIFPVGIEPGYFQTTSSEMVGTIQSSAEIRIIGVDRLDYTKGLPQKFRAFGHFLETHPEYRRRIVLTQIAAPSRESVEAYADIRQELQSLSGAINGELSELDWVPIHYINRTIPRSSLASIYRGSRIGLVTPLRDGMNLVAKEYVASQDPENPGVLILSKFAGAAEQLQEALIINPYNREEVGEAILIAVEMPLEERRRRHGALLTKIEQQDALHWSSRYLEALVRKPASMPEAKAPSEVLAATINRLQTLKEFQELPQKNKVA